MPQKVVEDVQSAAQQRLALDAQGEAELAGLVTVFDVTGRTPPRVLRGHDGAVIGAGWSPDGHWLASGGDDGIVYVWDAADDTLLQRLVGHHSTITPVVWSLDGARLAS